MSTINRKREDDSGTGRVVEDDLVASLRNGKQEAMGRVYDMYSASLYGVIFRIVRSDDVAEDVLQETLVKIWRNIASYDPSRGRLFTWMLNIARNQALDKLKSRGFQQMQKNQDVEKVVHLIDATSNSSYNPEQIGVREMLDSLDTDHQQIVQLIYFQGYTHSEVAKKLGIPLGTVKTRLRAAILLFRKAFI